MPPLEFELGNVQNVASRRSGHAIPASLVSVGIKYTVCSAVSGVWSYVGKLKYDGKRFGVSIVFVCVSERGSVCECVRQRLCGCESECVSECVCVCERERVCV